MTIQWLFSQHHVAEWCSWRTWQAQLSKDSIRKGHLCSAPFWLLNLPVPGISTAPCLPVAGKRHYAWSGVSAGHHPTQQSAQYLLPSYGGRSSENWANPWRGERRGSSSSGQTRQVPDCGATRAPWPRRGRVANRAICPEQGDCCPAGRLGDGFWR